MPDIEKVIKGLEFCTSTTGCTGCQYEDPCHDIEQRILGEAIMRDALELLKEQKPQRGKWIDIDSQLYTWKVRCDQCGHERSMMSTQGKYPKFCEGCGAEMMIGR